MQEDPRDTGLPTRAIHDAYLNLQQAHREFRQARNNTSETHDRAHARYQDAVITFYELIRPHLQRKSAMGKFWHGELPDYPERWWQSVDQAKRYCIDHGTAVWGLQKHIQSYPANSVLGEGSAVATDGGQAPPETWHETLGLTDMQRIVGVQQDDEVLICVELRAVAGLQQLDSWDTRRVQRREQQEGFMAGETTTTVELEYVPRRS